MHMPQTCRVELAASSCLRCFVASVTKPFLEYVLLQHIGIGHLQTPNTASPISKPLFQGWPNSVGHTLRRYSIDPGGILQSAHQPSEQHLGDAVVQRLVHKLIDEDEVVLYAVLTEVASKIGTKQGHNLRVGHHGSHDDVA